MRGNIKITAKMPHPPDFGDCTTKTLRNRVVEASKDIPAFIPYAPHKPAVMLHINDYINIEGDQIGFFVYGVIAYKDIHGNRYDTQFSVKYLSQKFGGSERFYPNPPEYNRYNEYGPENPGLSEP